MSGSRLDGKIFDILKSHPKVNIAEKTIRNEISKIRANHPGVTMNAAAALFARRRSFSIMRHLSGVDKDSLQNAGPITPQVIQPAKSRATRIQTASLPFGQPFLRHAYNNAQLYPYVYILENALRQLILDTLGNNTSWWDKKVPEKVRDYAKRIQGAEKKHDWLLERGKHPLFYVGLNELAKIIFKNYSQFKHIFADQQRFKTWIDESVPVRNLLAHNVKILADDRQYLKTRSRYICNLIEKNKAPKKTKLKK